MTDERIIATAYFGAVIAGALASNSQATLALAAASLLSLAVGYWRKATSSTAVAGILLYYPLSLALGHFVPGAWGYIASATILIMMSEWLSFEYHISTVLEAPLGIDEESRVLATRLSVAHKAKLLTFAVLAAGVSVLSLAVSGAGPNAPLLAAGTVVLLFLLWAYMRR